jgi:hypothetical protein
VKKNQIILTSLVAAFLLGANSFAASGNIYVSKSSVYVGDTFSVSVSITSSAAWNIHVTASGPVSGCTINAADATADAKDTNKTFTSSCKATGTGTITLSLSGDVTSASNGNAVYLSGSRTVTVTKKPSSNTGGNNTGGNTGSNTGGNTGGNKPTTGGNKKPTSNKSTNNKLGSISVDGYSLTKVNDNNYNLKVTHDIESVNVKATAADAKAKVSGTGKHNIKDGKNTIVVTITSESGAKNYINLTVTRKDGFYLEDLDYIIAKKINNADIIVGGDTKVSSFDIAKMKDSGMTFKLIYSNQSKRLISGWIIDGSKIGKGKDFNTTVSFDSEYRKEILKLSNYADGIIVSTHTPPDGSKLRLYVGDKFENGDLVNVYSYLPKELKKVSEEVEVKNGIVELDITGSNTYFLTMSSIASAETKPKEVAEIDSRKEDNNGPFIAIVVGALAAILLSVIVALIIVAKKKKKQTEVSEVSQPNPFASS